MYNMVRMMLCLLKIKQPVCLIYNLQEECDDLNEKNFYGTIYNVTFGLHLTECCKDKIRANCKVYILDL